MDRAASNFLREAVENEPDSDAVSSWTGGVGRKNRDDRRQAGREARAETAPDRVREAKGAMRTMLPIDPRQGSGLRPMLCQKSEGWTVFCL